MPTTNHQISFVSDYGKLWSVSYKMKDNEVWGIIKLFINDKDYTKQVRTVSRENLILGLVERQIDLREYAQPDREIFHSVDD